MENLKVTRGPGRIYEKPILGKVWKNWGKRGSFYGCSLCRLYVDKKTGKTCETHSLGLEHFDAARKVLDQAEALIERLKEDDEERLVGTA